MTTYGGYELLLIAPNAVSSWGASVGRTVDRAENQAANVVTATRADTGRDTRTLTWNCASRAELTAIRAVLDARRGQAEPLWTPTYQRDLEVLALVPFYGTVVTASVASGMLATVPAWRYWIVRTPGGALYRTKYWDTSNVDSTTSDVWTTSPGAGPTEIGTTVGNALTSTTDYCVWSRLLLCRMASDTYRVQVLGAVAVVEADFTEIPAEVP